MQKTKLGITVPVMGAAVILATYFGGVMVGLLAAGYVLLFEENDWLKRTAVKAVALSLAIDLLVAILGLIPGLLGFINNIVVLFNGNMSYVFISRLFSMLTNGVHLCETVLFIVLGIKALNQGTIAVGPIDKLVEKCLG